MSFYVTADMDTSEGLSIYPLHRCKTLHLVRHAQGTHNVAGEKNPEAFLSYDYFDAQLTRLGWEQVDHLRAHVQACGLSKKIELVIASPLLRTMQTAAGAFGAEAYTDGIDAPPLMKENVGHSEHAAISSLNCPPFIAVELCREHLGLNPCDKRRSIHEYRDMFPAIDFSLIESDEDILWTPDIREKDEDAAVRELKFLKWLWTRKEREIAIVSHSGFLDHALSAFGNDCHPTVKSEICKRTVSLPLKIIGKLDCTVYAYISLLNKILHGTVKMRDAEKKTLHGENSTRRICNMMEIFANCELRSMVIVDRGLVGSNKPTTNYPGKIPQGLDLPSDVAYEKNKGNGPTQ
ncbi:hypothetical protein K1719_022227 [Acacia pycnantha]|nr:hypothetical protein K1719_022227 [Acacia pycnantha]